MKIKYPRTYHFEWSKGATSDDKIQKDLSNGKGLFAKLKNKIESPKPAYLTEVPTKKLTIGNKLSKLSNNVKKDVGNSIFKKKRR